MIRSLLTRTARISNNSLMSSLLSDADKLDEKNALNVRFQNSPRLSKTCSLKLKLSSDAQLFMIANFDCINEIQLCMAKAFDK